MIALRNNSDVAVSKSAKQSTRLTRLREDLAVEIELPQNDERQDACRNAAAGERITAGQWMLLAQPCATLPPVLVAAA